MEPLVVPLTIEASTNPIQLEGVLAVAEDPLHPTIFLFDMSAKSATNLATQHLHATTGLTTHSSMKTPLTCRLSLLLHAHLPVMSTGTRILVLPTMSQQIWKI
jgi:hypothetical protein